MSCCASSGDHYPPEVTVSIKHPHPSREASVVIVTWWSPWLIRVYAVGRLVTYHLRSIMASLGKPMVLSKFPLCNFKACVLSISRNLWCSGPYITPGKLAFISPNTWATILIEGDKVSSRFSQACLHFRILSEVSCLRLEKTGFCSFVNFRGQRANPLGKQTNWYKTPFHSNLRN